MSKHPATILSALFPLPLALLATTAAGRAQCGEQWRPDNALRSIHGEVIALATLANGDYVAAGNFAFADASTVANVARWDGTEWRGLGAGLDGPVHDLIRLPNGDLLAGGHFQNSGGTPTANLARWNGVQWSPFAGGTDGSVDSLAVMQNGDVVAAGQFTFAGGVPANHIARWDGTAWAALGAGLGGTPFQVADLAIATNGDLFVAGFFQLAGTTPTTGLARWNGANWSGFPQGPSGASGATALAALPNGDLAVGFDTEVAVWNGTTFTTLGANVASRRALAVDANGTLIAAGYSYATLSAVSYWTGTAWQSVGPATARNVDALLVLANGHVVAGGSKANPAAVATADTVTEFDGVAWQPIGRAQPAAEVRQVVTLRNGDVVAVGAFDRIEGTPANHVARWSGGQWQALGSGTDGIVSLVAEAANGDLVVSGAFTSAGGVPANNIARWDGAAWSPLGSGLPPATRMAVASNGEVIAAAGDLRRWDGAQWSPIPWPSPVAFASALATAADGTILAGGLGLGGGPSVFRWVNGAWVPWSSSPSGIYVMQLHTLPNGDLLATTNFGLSRWNGSTWTTLPGAVINSPLGHMPNGNPLATLVVGTHRELVQHDGTTWLALGTLRDGISGVTTASSVAASRTGDLFAAGNFVRVDDQVSAGFAHGVATCPAAALPFGAGCSGSAGLVALQAADLPWLGGAFTGTVTGIPQQAIAVLAYGTPVPPIALPLGAPGCGLYVDPLALDILTPTAGTATVALAIPNVPNLVGIVVRAQAVVLELGSGGAIAQTTSSNALQLVLGAL